MYELYLPQTDFEYMGDERANLLISADHDKCAGDDDLGLCVKALKISTRSLDIYLGPVCCKLLNSAQQRMFNFRNKICCTERLIYSRSW